MDCSSCGYYCPCFIPCCPCCNPSTTTVQVEKTTTEVQAKPITIDDINQAEKLSNKPLMMPDDPDPFTSPENRLEKRDKLFCEDDTVALAIKSGDTARIKWLFDKGYPLNYNIQDTDGMCYEATELAKHHNQDEVVAMFQEMMKKGPPRQKITVTYEGKAQEYVIPNSGEDEKMFRAEIRWFNKLDPRAQLNIYQTGDVDKMNLKWSKMREGRKYICELA